MMNIKAFKLINGEEVLAEVENESEFDYHIVNPVGIAVMRGQDGRPNVGFAPFPIHAEQKSGSKMTLAKMNVVYEYVPAEDFISNYNSIFGSGIVLPKKDLILG
jgi:hypothetical protein